MKTNNHLRILAGVIVASSLFSGTSYASPVTLQVDVNISTAYDYVKSQNVAIFPLAGSFNFTFDDAGVTRVCAPNSCPNQTVFPNGIGATSTLSALVPSNYGNGIGYPEVIYAPDFGTSQYVGDFDWANAGTTIFDAASGKYLTHAIYVAVLKLSINTSAYGTVTEFLLAALNNRSAFQVIAGEVWYSSPLDKPMAGTFTQGFDWRDYSAVITRVNDQHNDNSPINVPEPSSALMTSIGLFALFVARLRLRRLVSTAAK